MNREPQRGDYVLMNHNLLKVIGTDYRGYDTIQKVELDGIEPGYQRWFWAEELEFITKEDNPEYFL